MSFGSVINDILDCVNQKDLYVSSSLAGVAGAVLEYIENNPQSAIYFFCFGGVALVGSALKTFRDHKSWIAEERRKEEEHEKKMNDE